PGDDQADDRSEIAVAAGRVCAVLPTHSNRNGTTNQPAISRLPAVESRSMWPICNPLGGIAVLKYWTRGSDPHPGQGRPDERTDARSAGWADGDRRPVGDERRRLHERWASADGLARGGGRSRRDADHPGPGGRQVLSVGRA